MEHISEALARAEAKMRRESLVTRICLDFGKDPNSESDRMAAEVFLDTYPQTR